MSETSVIGINILLFLLAIFVAWGRSKKAAIAPNYHLYKHSLNQK
jgi:hypothetical protein